MKNSKFKKLKIAVALSLVVSLCLSYILPLNTLARSSQKAGQIEEDKKVHWYQGRKGDKKGFYVLNMEKGYLIGGSQAIQTGINYDLENNFPIKIERFFNFPAKKIYWRITYNNPGIFNGRTHVGMYMPQNTSKNTVVISSTNAENSYNPYYGDLEGFKNDNKGIRKDSIERNSNKERRFNEDWDKMLHENIGGSEAMSNLNSFKDETLYKDEYLENYIFAKYRSGAMNNKTVTIHFGTEHKDVDSLFDVPLVAFMHDGVTSFGKRYLGHAKFAAVGAFGKAAYREIKYNPFFVDNQQEFLEKASNNDSYALADIDKAVYDATSQHIIKTYSDQEFDFNDLYNKKRLSKQASRLDDLNSKIASAMTYRPVNILKDSGHLVSENFFVYKFQYDDGSVDYIEGKKLVKQRELTVRPHNAEYTEGEDYIQIGLQVNDPALQNFSRVVLRKNKDSSDTFEEITKLFRVDTGSQSIVQKANYGKPLGIDWSKVPGTDGQKTKTLKFDVVLTKDNGDDNDIPQTRKTVTFTVKQNPKFKEFIANAKNVPDQIEGQAIKNPIQTINANDKFTVEKKEQKGMTLNEDGNLSGTPSGLSWGEKGAANYEEQKVDFDAKVTSQYGIERKLTIPVKVLRDTDRDGQADKDDDDDDGDGIPDAKDKEPKKANGLIVIEKLNQNNEPITTQEATFKLWKEDEVNINNGEVTPKTQDKQAITIQTVNGRVIGKSDEVSIDPQVQNWILVEEKAPDNYHKTTKPIKLALAFADGKYKWSIRETNPDATVADDGITIKVKNKQTSIVIEKTDSEGNIIKGSSAIFEIWKRTDRQDDDITKAKQGSNSYKIVEIGNDGISPETIFEDSSVRNIVLVETKAPEGYQKLQRPVELQFVNENGKALWKVLESSKENASFDDGEKTLIDNEKFEKTGSWNSEKNTKYLNGTNMWTDSVNSSVTIKFTGTKAEVIGTKANNHGKAEVWLDGKNVGTIDTSSNSRQDKAVIYTTPKLEHKEHTIKLVSKTKALGVDGLYYWGIPRVKIKNKLPSLVIEKTDDRGNTIKNSSASFEIWKRTDRQDDDITKAKTGTSAYKTVNIDGSGFSSEIGIEDLDLKNIVLIEKTAPNNYIKLAEPIELNLVKKDEKLVWQVAENSKKNASFVAGKSGFIDDRAFKKSEGWVDETGAQYEKGTNTYSQGTAREITVTFTGTNAKLIGTKANNHGEAEVWLDGENVGTIDTSTTGRKDKSVIYTTPDLDHKEHTIKLVSKDKPIGVDGLNYWEASRVQVKNHQVKLQIEKTDNNGNPIRNNSATFEVWNREDRQKDISKPKADKNKFQAIQTKPNGKTDSIVVSPDISKLVLIESQAPTGYRKLTKPIELTLNKETLKWEVDSATHPEVSVDENGIVKIQNKKQIVIEKLDEEGNLIPNSTATFEIWRLRDVKLQNGKLVLDENGNIIPKYHHSTPMRAVTVTNGKSDPIDIANGDVNILIFEKKAPEGYNKMTDPIKLAVNGTKNQWSLVNPNDVPGVEVEDEMTVKVKNKKKTVVKFGKINLKGNALYNMKLKIKPVEGNENKPIFKNTKGDYEGQELENEKALTWYSRIIKNKWPEIELGDGKYTLEELETTEGYSKFAPFNIEVKEGVVSVKAPDSLNANDIAIVESGTMPLVKIKNYKGEMKINVIDNSTPENKHKDVKFKLVKDGKLVGSASTGTNGSLTFTNIEPGTYKLTQETGPNWFHLNEKTYTIEVLPDYKVSIKNKDNKLSVKEGSPTVKKDGITKLIELDFTIDKNLPLGVFDGGNTSYLILIFVGISALVSIVIYSINKRRKAL